MMENSTLELESESILGEEEVALQKVLGAFWLHMTHELTEELDVALHLQQYVAMLACGVTQSVLSAQIGLAEKKVAAEYQQAVMDLEKVLVEVQALSKFIVPSARGAIDARGDFDLKDPELRRRLFDFLRHTPSAWESFRKGGYNSVSLVRLARAQNRGMIPWFDSGDV